MEEISKELQRLKPLSERTDRETIEAWKRELANFKKRRERELPRSSRLV